MSLSSVENLELLFKQIEEQESFQPLLDLCSDTIVFRATIREGTPISGTFSGKRKVAQYFNEILPKVASFKQLQPLDFIVSANTVVVLGDDEYTCIKNASKYHSPYAMVLKTRNNLINEILIIQDLSVLWEAYNN